MFYLDGESCLHQQIGKPIEVVPFIMWAAVKFGVNFGASDFRVGRIGDPSWHEIETAEVNVSAGAI